MKALSPDQKFLLLLPILAFCLLCGGCSQSQPAKADSPNYENSLFENLYKTQNLSITIETDIEQILLNKDKDEKLYQEAVIKIHSGQSTTINGLCTIRPRGVTRKRLCDFPPLMIRVNEDQSTSLGIGQSENIKLVTYCKDSLKYEGWIAKEYLAYKLFNELSNESFRVKLATVTYQDNEDQTKKITKDGFIIEPLEELSSRLSCTILEDDEAIKNIHRDKYKVLTVFQYMIGNSDWNFSNRHNIRLLSCDPKYGPIPIPYDFDYSGLVNADYAKPHPMLPIDKVTDRLFQWRGSVDEDFSETISFFRTKKEKMTQICHSILSNNDNSQESVANYLNDFFELATTPNHIRKEIIKARKK